MTLDRLSFSTHRDPDVAMAKKYVWWKTPEETLAAPALLLAQLMTLGTVEDVRWMLTRTSSDELRDVLRDPPVGVFNARSWTYWHRRLNGEPVPLLPARMIPA